MMNLENDLFDNMEDMQKVQGFFKTQRIIFDNAVKQLEGFTREKEYLQTEEKALEKMMTAKSIIAMEKPYKRINELPGMMQDIQNIYQKLLDDKKEDIYSEIQAAMAEVHQAANVTQQDTVKRADDALGEKKQSAAEATSLIALDAMKIQIENIRGQYLKLLVTETAETNSGVPAKKIKTINRSGICMPRKLETEEEIDSYLSDIKEKLMEMLKENDGLHII